MELNIEFLKLATEWSLQLSETISTPLAKAESFSRGVLECSGQQMLTKIELEQM
jgi:hypothetical protein